MDNLKAIKRAVHWAFAAVAVLLIVSGFGVSDFRVMEALTFGLLGKANSFMLHGYLTWPFVILFALHLYFVLVHKRVFKKK